MRAEPDEPQEGVAIVGGGTAGYLAALTLRALNPELKIDLIESSRIPIIGVGESTTTEIVPFLHTVLGFDVEEFYRKVLPTWKLGIKFVWGPLRKGCFNYPFDRGPILESHLYEGHGKNFSLSSALMTADVGLLLEVGGEHLSLLPSQPYGYHLDNRRFVAYLREKALERRVHVSDLEIVDALLTPGGGSIDRLVTSDGQKLKYDFYVDCTGFRSLLIEKALGSKYISYSESLYTDSAVVANAPHSGHIKPYTTAETMNSGWCWNIPQVDEDHLGYVFSSAFCSVDEAEAELREKNPGVHGLWSLKFRSGRHEEFIKGNVAAVGNSYGFVEPLESTAIFVICRECLILARHFAAIRSNPSVTHSLNAILGSIWDYIRWFLSIHYRFNDRITTPFWRECRDAVAIDGAAPILSLYQQAAPLTYREGGSGFAGGPNFDAFGYDALLLGQSVPAHYLSPRQSRDEYLDHLGQIQIVVARAMQQDQALDVLLKEKPWLLRESLAAESWVPRLAEAMLVNTEDAAVNV